MLQTPSRDPETYRIIGAAMAVHRELGHGFLEAVYREALPIEFERRKIPFRPEVVLPIRYQGIQLPTHYKADFICEGGVIVEVKALDSISSHDEAQLLNYLKASGIRRGLLINFGAVSLEYRRRVWGYE
jgi:GxxExxY protein